MRMMSRMTPPFGNYGLGGSRVLAATKYTPSATSRLPREKNSIGRKPFQFMDGIERKLFTRK
jgi:hypothetical protein